MSARSRLSVPSAADLGLPIAPGGPTRAGLLVFSGLPAFLVFPPLGVVLVGLAPVVLFFYRDPGRETPPGGLVAPADGTVAVLRREDDGRVRLGVYMSPFDVHVVRSPVRGALEEVRHEPGTHWPAQTKLSERNEKLHLTYRGGDVEVTMIAGVLARVITGYVDTGETVDRGERVGHIAFGSRTDVLLPAGVAPGDVEVGPGESTTAGETVILGPEAFERATEQKRDGKDGKTRTVVGTGDDAETIKE